MGKRKYTFKDFIEECKKAWKMLWGENIDSIKENILDEKYDVNEQNIKCTKFKYKLKFIRYCIFIFCSILLLKFFHFWGIIIILTFGIFYFKYFGLFIFIFCILFNFVIYDFTLLGFGVIAFLLVYLNLFLSKNFTIKNYFLFFIDLFIIMSWFICVNNFWYLQLWVFKIKNHNNIISIEKIGEMKEMRGAHNMSPLSESKILITGGDGQQGYRNAKTTEILDLNTNKTFYGPNMNFAHCTHVQLTMKNGDIYIIDTNGIELLEQNNQSKFKVIYKPSNDTFKNPDIRIRKFSYKILENDNIFVYNNDFKILIDTKKKNVIENPQITQNIKNIKEVNYDLLNQTFNLFENNYITFFFQYGDKDFILDSYIKIFNNKISNTYSTHVQPFSAILQVNPNTFITTGGLLQKYNCKFNYFFKQKIKGDSIILINSNLNRLPYIFCGSKVIYKVNIKEG